MVTTAKKTTISKPPTQAIGPDPRYMLDLAPNFKPDIDMVIREGIAAFGVRGSGKSTALARLLEQLSRYPIPYLVPDTKGEYTGLDSIYHATRFIVATANDCPTGQEILQERLQVVMDLRSWETDEGAALALTQLLNEMFAYASTQEPENCIPCPVILDEAQYWLPQNQVPYLDKEIAHDLRATWQKIATRARSYGLITSCFTQSISEIHKSVIRQCGLFILMRQTLDNDIERYQEYIHGVSPTRLKSAIRSLLPGRAIIVLPNGEQVKTAFYQRESKHPSNTPSVRGLLARLGESAPAPQPAAPQECKKQTGGRPRKQPAAPTLPPHYERIYAALDKDSGLSPYELVARIGCDLETAKQARYTYFQLA